LWIIGGERFYRLDDVPVAQPNDVSALKGTQMWPEKVTHWTHLSLIHYRTPEGRGVATLMMICNDFLIVKVNCWLYVFNIMKYIYVNIEENITN